jgi:hypothetical protein
MGCSTIYFQYSISFLLFSCLPFIFPIFHGIWYTRDVLSCILRCSYSINVISYDYLWVHTVTETYVILYFQVVQIISIWCYFKFLSFTWFFILVFFVLCSIFYYYFYLCDVIYYKIYPISINHNENTMSHTERTDIWWARD